MSKFASKFKGQDFKRLAVEHGEKVGFALILLIVIGAFASTQWGRYTEDPGTLSSNAASARQRIQSTDWPDEEKDKYARHTNPAEAFNNRVARLTALVSPGRYEFAWNPFWQLPSSEGAVREEPKWLAVSDLLADAAHLVLLERPQDARPQQIANQGAAPGQPGDAPFNPFDPNALRKRLNAANNPPPAAAAPSLVAVDDRSMPKPVPTRVVAVRGVFGLQKQLAEIARAINLPSTQQQLDPSMLTIQGFELQRQEAVPGPDPWGGPWKPVDIEESKRVIRKAVAFSEERVNPAVTDSRITSPMPELAFGDYGDLETHPAVKAFHLTTEGIELQERLDEILREYEQQAAASSREGFSDVVLDRRSLRQQLVRKGLPVGAESRIAETFSQDQIQELRVTATGQLLLFRYFDFNVDPGKTYRYRVRLKVQNPNFGLSPEQIRSPEVAEGEFRFTPWSAATEPVTVPPDTEYFVRQIGAGRPGQPAATFHLYQWYSKIGTLVAAELRSEFGALIGGKVTTNVAYPNEPGGESLAVLREEPVEFHTRDMLIDVAEVPSLDRNLHADLGASSQSVIGQALIADEGGRLQPLDPVSRDEEYRAAAQRLETQWFQQLNVRLPDAEEDLLDRGARNYDAGAAAEQNLRQQARRRGLIDSPYRRQR